MVKQNEAEKKKSSCRTFASVNTTGAMQSVRAIKTDTRFFFPSAMNGLQGRAPSSGGLAVFEVVAATQVVLPRLTHCSNDAFFARGIAHRHAYSSCSRSS